ncbi:hypothetical protein MaudCBS49596_000872 [Microsporum audouinii]
MDLDPTVNIEGAYGSRSGHLTITRRNVEDFTVFGTGYPAFCHVRPALLLQDSQIKSVNIFIGSFERASQLQKDIYSLTKAQ